MDKKKCHIFYMEDEELILENWSAILESKGYRITKAANSVDALNAIDRFLEQNEVVDVFMLDIIIFPWDPFTEEETLSGYITGLKVADYIIRKYKGVKDDYKIVFATAVKGVPGQINEIVEAYLKENADKCSILQKPIKLDRLLSLI